MEIYQDEKTRRRIIVFVGNALVDAGETEKYNAVCGIVKKYFVSSLTLNETHVEFTLSSKSKKVKYTKTSDIEWLETKIKDVHDEMVYEQRARVKGVYVLPNKKSKQLAEAIVYALTLDPVINKQDDDIILTAKTLTYSFNLNNLCIKERKIVDDAFALKRLEALAKKHNL